MKEPWRSRSLLLDSTLIFLLACVLILPLFGLEYLDNWASIESTFISDARMLRDNLPHPGWQPLWYCGTRFDYIYPPALRYGTALLSLLLDVSTARAYHLYIAVLYALGIVGVYWLAYAGSRSRLQGWVAALLTALMSPSLVLIAELRHDSPWRVPQRLHVLMSYGEGPHMSALALAGFALAASFVALRRWSPASFAAAGALCAAVVSNNFYGATALALFFPILAWAVFLEVWRPAVWARAVGIAAVAYGLCAFWLSPSYLWITRVNLQWVAPPSSPWSGVVTGFCVVIFCAVTYRLAKPGRQVAWPVFLLGSAIFTSIYVLGAYYYNFTLSGNGQRLAPELDLALLLIVAWCLSTAWSRPLLRSGIVVLLCAGSSPAVRYVRHAWTIFPPAASVRERCEFDIPKWMHDHLPGARALPSGSIRFWYNAWHDNDDAYGNSNQGMLNQHIIFANWEITQGTDAGAAIAWLQALGADAVIVPDKTSQEIYHDYSHPEKFRGALPVLYDDNKGTVIYRVPRRFPALARVIERASLKSATLEKMPNYVAQIEHGPDSEVTLKRSGFDAFELRATISPGQGLLFQETFDPAWHAYAEGRPLRITPDPMDFMLVDAPAGKHTIQMRFETPLENRVGWVVTGLTCASLLGLFWLALWPRALRLRGRRRSPTTAC